MYQISDELYALKILNHFIQVESAESRSNLRFDDFDEVNIGIYQNTNENIRSLIELRNEAYGKTLVLKNNRNEFVKHKILDAVGDLYLLGHSLIGEFVAKKSGHGLNNQLLRALGLRHGHRRPEFGLGFAPLSS